MDEERIINAISKMVANKANIDYYGASGAEICDWLESKKSSEHAALQFAIEILNNHGYINTAKCLEKYFNYAPSPDDTERKQLYSDGFDTARKALANTLMQYLDEHRPEGKMCLSQLECEALMKAFKNGDVETIVRYIIKYQRPAEWSKEDTCILEDAVTAVDLLGNDDEYSKTHPNLAKAFRVAKNWLKSLPERFNLQPKQEWSEEDELHLKNAILAAEKEWGVDSRTANWLKSLRPKPHWKPSEEQMIALRQAISGCSYDIEPLVSLENQLKQL